MNNVALQIALEDEDLDAWDGLCGELADAVLHQYPEAKILYVQLEDCPMNWGWHMVPVIDGLVHDAWHPDQILPPAEYVQAVFADSIVIEWEINPEPGMRSRPGPSRTSCA